MGHPHGARAWRQFRGVPAVAAGFRRPRPAMVPGQPAASGRAAGARPALGVAASPAHRNRIVSDGAALADLSGAWNPDLVAGAVCPARIFSERIFAISAVAGAGPDPRGLGLPTHDGTADRSLTPGLPAAAHPTRKSTAVRGRPCGSCRHPDRDIVVRPDRARDDDLSIHRGRRNPAWTRCGLAGAASRRWYRGTR